MNQWPFVCCKESWDMKDDKGNIHYLETWSLWRTSTALTLLKIEQEGGVGGAGEGEGDTQVRGENRAQRDFTETFCKQNIKAKCAEVHSRLL